MLPSTPNGLLDPCVCKATMCKTTTPTIKKGNKKCSVLNLAISSSEKEVEFYDVHEGLAQMSGINDIY